MKYKRIKNRFKKFLKEKHPDMYEGDYAFLENREDLIWEYHKKALDQKEAEVLEKAIKKLKQLKNDKK